MFVAWFVATMIRKILASYDHVTINPERRFCALAAFSHEGFEM